MSDKVAPKAMKPPKIKNYKRAKGWKSALLFTLSVTLIAGAIILRLIGGVDEESQLEEIAKAQLEKEEQNKKPSYLEVKTIDTVGAFSEQVKPVSFENVLLEERNQDTAFQDAEYIAERKDVWTIQVMDVSKIEIIRDYLATHEKRDQFAYFRYVDKDKNKRYILTFDDFNDKDGAQKAIDEMQFDLPASIKPFPHSFKKYLRIVEQYHLENKVKEYKKSRYREIKLKKTKAPVYAVSNEASEIYSSKNKNTTSALDYIREKAKQAPSHKDYVNRAMKNNNAFAEQAPKQGRVIVSKHDKQDEANLSDLINEINQ